jgi:hypothetical protein
MRDFWGVMPRASFLLVPVVCCVAACTAQKYSATVALTDYEPRDGDFLFQSLPHNPLIDTIEGSTESPFSHCGIVVNRSGTWKVIEAIGPVKETHLSLWIAQGRNNAYVAYRLKAPLAGKIPQIITAAERYEGRPYDIRYDFDDGKIYCSELLWKATRDAAGVKLGKIQKLGDLKWQHHEDVIKGLENGLLPLDREMITPRALTEDARLEEVYRNRM